MKTAFQVTRKIPTLKSNRFTLTQLIKVIYLSCRYMHAHIKGIVITLHSSCVLIMIDVVFLINTHL